MSDKYKIYDNERPYFYNYDNCWLDWMGKSLPWI